VSNFLNVSITEQRLKEVCSFLPALVGHLDIAPKVTIETTAVIIVRRLTGLRIDLVVYPSVLIVGVLRGLLGVETVAKVAVGRLGAALHTGTVVALHVLLGLGKGFHIDRFKRRKRKKEKESKRKE